MATDPNPTTSGQCGTCRHWKRIDGEAGNCWPPMPYWRDDGAGCATWKDDGKNCKAWWERTDVQS